MNRIVFILTFFTCICLFSACKDKQTKSVEENLQIDIESRKTMALDAVFDRIEIIPMETNENSLIGSLDYVRFVDDTYFMFVDRSMNIILFDRNGRYISNSSKVNGPGPEEYYTLIDLAYNSSLDCIEVLTSSMSIMRFDTAFNFIEKFPIAESNVRIFNNFFPIDSVNYLLKPSVSVEEEKNNVYVYNIKTNKFDKKFQFEEPVAGIHQNNNPIRFSDGTFFFLPQGIVASGYRFETVKSSFSKLFTVNFVGHRIDVNDPKLKVDHEKVNGHVEVYDYLVAHKDYALPFNTLFNNRYIATRIKYQKEFFYHVYNRKQGNEYFISKFTNGFQIPEFVHIQDNALYAVIKASDVNKYKDLGIVTNYVDTLDMDDNPCIAVFYLAN